MMLQHSEARAAPAISAARLTKTYPNGVRAVRDVSLSVDPGEIRAIVGENGAGKSTLMKLLYGMEQPTSGQVLINGQVRHLAGPTAAIDLGVGMVHQHLMLVPSFTIAENVVLGVEPGPAVRIDSKAAVEATRRLAAECGLTVEPQARVDEVSVGMRQRAEILKALHRGARILILDEPTAVLTPQETDDLFAAIRRLRDTGMTVLFISHKLKEVREISDRVTVMRGGVLAGTIDTAEATADSLAAMMVGREVSLEVVKAPATQGRTVLAVRRLHYGQPGKAGSHLRELDFDVAAGEIVGLAGIEGHGQTELAEILTGMRQPRSGSVRVDGREMRGLSVAEHRRAGVAHVPEDRLLNGVALDQSIADNLIVARHAAAPVTRRGLLRRSALRTYADRVMRDFDIRAPDQSVPIRALSGGNMQKVVVGRELSSKPRLLVAAQLTRGVDIGAMHFMYSRLISARDEGAAILLVSADLTELLQLSDRLLVIKDGELVARFDDVTELDEKQVGLHMLGVERHDRATICAGLEAVDAR